MFFDIIIIGSTRVPAILLSINIKFRSFNYLTN